MNNYNSNFGEIPVEYSRDDIFKTIILDEVEAENSYDEVFLNPEEILMPKIKKIVEARLMAGFNTEIDLETYSSIEFERKSLNLYRKVLNQEDLKDVLVSKIAEYAYNLSAYTLKSPTKYVNYDTKESKLIAFNRKIVSFLSSYQCVLLAISFEKQMQEEQSNYKSR